MIKCKSIYCTKVRTIIWTVKKSTDDKIVARENGNTMSTQHQPLTMCWHFLFLLFCHLLTFSNGPYYSLEFVPYFRVCIWLHPCAYKYKYIDLRSKESKPTIKYQTSWFNPDYWLIYAYTEIWNYVSSIISILKQDKSKASFHKTTKEYIVKQASNFYTKIT